MGIFSSESLSRFSSAYPLQPVTMRHSLADEPLLALETLRDAAGQLPTHHVERRIANAANGGDFAMAAEDSMSIGETISKIASGNSWVMLRFVEQLPEYRALLERIMQGLSAQLLPVTGPPLDLKGFIFISAPETLTPFHFDAEYNILFQISGDKDFATYPPQLPFLSQAQREAYHVQGKNLLGWEDGYDEAASVHSLSGGDALYVPYAAPHWVRAGKSHSVSLSVTWQSQWSQSARDALQFNPMLRRLRLPGANVPVWPKVPAVRSLAYRIARKARVL